MNFFLILMVINKRDDERSCVAFGYTKFHCHWGCINVDLRIPNLLLDNTFHQLLLSGRCYTQHNTIWLVLEYILGLHLLLFFFWCFLFWTPFADAAGSLIDLTGGNVRFLKIIIYYDWVIAISVSLIIFIDIWELIIRSYFGGKWFETRIPQEVNSVAW